MARAEDALTVQVCHALPGSAWIRSVTLPVGSTITQAVAASGFAAAFPGVDPFAQGVSIYGVLREPDHVLEPDDRVEILRALSFDPMESRRRRAAHKAAADKAR